ncbi:MULTISPECIES: DUF916 and DUF3324 domain-containing protein [Ligilactobacillus]|uniref:DUF916 and DUF3324 domain-containing protein n=1 Tax=Ligilactobacillus TaxID=2767887 RepID=UPI001369DB00|nr:MULTISPECIES: DUF916 and DUF3324 domain-containing protein [Ligilactobacillus]MCZ0743679.1 DUF916 and DUF3324 domain-containing protein [Ligilactobacillus sp. UO.C109]MDM8263139.1 DUF916 and DUF3324 domain-containing protein [Ligilactobacillus salivarius]MYU93621.1 DUF916 and DUF3324 domain-containing protein [Ligilactobacillus salivarius]
MVRLKTNSIVKLFLCIVLCICFFKVPNVSADSIANNAAEFTISPVYPREQKEDDAGYFDLNVKKSTKVPVKVKISNLNKNQDIDYIVKVGNAITNNDGTINYTDFKNKKDKTAKYQLTDLVSKKELKQKVTVKAGESTKVIVNLNVPKQAFAGVIVGGIYVERLTNSYDNTKNGVNTKNHFSMTLPVVITEQAKAKRIAKMELDKVTVKNGPEITAKLHNVKPVMFGKLSIDSKITKKNHTKTLVHKSVNNYQVAPNSSFDYLVSDSSNQLGAGKYTLDMHLQSGKRKWHLVKDFVITSKQGAPLTKQTGWLGISMMLWIVVIILILIIASLVAVIMWQRKKLKS